MNLYNNLVIPPYSNALFVAKEIREVVLKLVNNQVPIKGVKDSSHDFDQTVHRTVDIDDLNSFWSSGGSDTAESTEWLIFDFYDSP
mmetsp:Transcript_12641/g.11190  ORF Transcript_12641/g.11190 Transcript_12641/m.11190 type:complete len:86 (-) Transcript_12641:1314-1571(-)